MCTPCSDDSYTSINAPVQTLERGLECDGPTNYLHFPGFRSPFSHWRFRWSCLCHSPLFPGHLPHRSSTKPLPWMGLVCIDYKTNKATHYWIPDIAWYISFDNSFIQDQNANCWILSIIRTNMLLVLNFKLKELFQFLHSKNLILKLSKNCNFSLLLLFFNVYNIEE